MDKKNLSLTTRAIHAGTYSPDEDTHQSVIPPLYRSTIFQHEPEGLRPDDRGYSYTRLNNPNRAQWEQVLTNLEGGSQGLAFASGMAAIHAVFQLLHAGDHLLMANDIYHGTKVLAWELADRGHLSCDFVDMRDPDALRSAIRSNTKLIWLETPSNPLLQIMDIEQVGSIAKASEPSPLVAVDNTWPTPVITRPLELGADLVVHSTTKYLGGHSDLLGGAVVVGNRAMRDGTAERLRTIQHTAGAVPSPEDCWWLTRSVKTLPYRMKAHNEHAQQLAEWLQEQAFVENVFYPGLASHPGHEVAARQMEGFGGMISFEVSGGAEQALALVNGTEIITASTSLGGVESTWEHRRSSENDQSTTSAKLVRLSVGLEDPEDLIADIEQALGNLKSGISNE